MRRQVFVRPAIEVALGFAALTALLAPWLGAGHVTVVSLLYLLATLVVAARWGYVAGFGAAALANIVVNFFFVSPLHRFAVATGDNVAALAVFMGVAAVGAFMLSRAREQAARAKAHQAAAERLLAVTRDVAGAGTPQAALSVLCAEFARTLGARGCALLVGEPLVLRAATIDERSNQPPTRDELAVAAEAWRRGQTVKIGRDQRTRQESSFVPVGAGERAVLRLAGGIDDGAIGGTVFAGLVNELHTTMRRAALDVEAARARELEVAGEFKQLLLAGVSHDLRTPLTAIKAAVSNLRNDTVAWAEDDRAEFLGTIDAQTDRLTRTVANILAMQRIESGAAQPAFELIEVAPLLAEVALNAAADRRRISQCAPGELWVRADYGLLVQALSNLVENAAKYGDPEATIRVEGSSAPGRVFLSVESAGPGIDETDLPHIFERYYRGSGTTTGSGSGLGLALVKAIVEGAGGSVAAASNSERTRFTISLPMAAAPS